MILLLPKTSAEQCQGEGKFFVCEKPFRKKDGVFLFLVLTQYIAVLYTMYYKVYRERRCAVERDTWLSQVRRGILEYNILLLVMNKSMYGYELITALNLYDVLSTTEGTLYPLLKRLEKEGLVIPTWKETTPGVPPRKYYDLTEKGITTLDMMNHEWGCLVSAIAHIKKEKEIENE